LYSPTQKADNETNKRRLLVEYDHAIGCCCWRWRVTQ